MRDKLGLKSSAEQALLGLSDLLVNFFSGVGTRVDVIHVPIQAEWFH
jgi:hypothetical protein